MLSLYAEFYYEHLQQDIETSVLALQAFGDFTRHCKTLYSGSVQPLWLNYQYNAQTDEGESCQLWVKVTESRDLRPPVLVCFSAATTDRIM
ncbi:hypothetical protein J6590_090467 [Homalodisca vitripennis]|nr:hypothetical protein J6590_090467 [Homalodisca vitripennis]